MGQVSIRWVPGHSGVEGNKLADLEAKKGASMIYLDPSEHFLASLKNWQEAREKESREEWWRANIPQSYSKLEINSAPRAPKELLFTRRSLGQLIAARTGHGDFAAYHSPETREIVRRTIHLRSRQAPVDFGVSVEINDDDNSEFRQQDQTVGVLVDNIHEAGEHRFRKLRTEKANEHEYDYCCCQDFARARKRETSGKRDRLQKKRYRCNSKLSIKPDLINRRLTVVLRHKYHAPYVNIRLSTAALAFASKLPGVDRVAEHQVYYQWQCANSSLWKRDADPVIPASEFLDENRSKYQHATYLSGNLRGLAFYIRGTMNALVSRAKFVTDITNSNVGMSLSAVLAELDGTGVPLCYLFVGTASISDQKLSSADGKGATTCILKQFLQPLKDAGYSPKFFGYRQLVIRPQLKPRAKLLSSDTDADLGSDIDAESNSESDVESEILNESSDENSESPEDYADDVISTMRFLLETIEKQKELGNTKFLEVFKANNTKNWELAAEIKQREKKKPCLRHGVTIKTLEQCFYSV
ncbi:hypothetical protein K3495_g9466 [Podosphaera aphanis]|nr:hypothetical protein K3495_g9466 [Podosphaera aphanis]